jgi:hypothetical protein
MRTCLRTPIRIVASHPLCSAVEKYKARSPVPVPGLGSGLGLPRPSPGADVGRMGQAKYRYGWGEPMSWCKCERGEPSRGAHVEEASPVPRPKCGMGEPRLTADTGRRMSQVPVQVRVG